MAYRSIDPVATGRRLKSLREIFHVKVSEIQTYMEFNSPNAIYRWERGETIPSHDSLCNLHDFYEEHRNYTVHLEDIFVRYGEEKSAFVVEDQALGIGGQC